VHSWWHVNAKDTIMYRVRILGGCRSNKLPSLKVGICLMGQTGEEKELNRMLMCDLMVITAAGLIMKTMVAKEGNQREASKAILHAADRKKDQSHCMCVWRTDYGFTQVTVGRRSRRGGHLEQVSPRHRPPSFPPPTHRQPQVDTR
jgi:hypothetical protein